ncbi:MAG6410 family transglutaminase-related lipoprotein [Mycoplasma mycoides]|uniref:MAG6410 family transglutaminase-related lipoprotein n=1 Tax=Mycoplasma mycoides TaxID=2102 RepID=UPI00223F94C0|nr:transglutaminase domain-containing protein [Mycoplasma mycoides]QVK03074.1 lipoprotein [Mycoplasma mycoides subsp. capri]QVK03890.1 lipoprotein [Mycoplasma mycoides subsp. capri]
MKRTKLISILTCLTALTSSIVVVSCSNDKTTTLHNKQINISKLDLNTNLYDIKDNTPKTIIKTFLDINNHKLSNLNENQLEVKMINDSSAIINIKNSNQFIGNTNIKFEAKENKINPSNKTNPTVITNAINWTSLTPALININSLNLITNLTNLNNSDNTTILDEFLKVNQTVLKDLSINNFEIIKKEGSTLIIKVKDSKKYFGTIELKFEIKEPIKKTEVETVITKPASSTKPQPRKKREVKKEDSVIKKEEVIKNSVPLTPLTEAKKVSTLIRLTPATSFTSLTPIKPATPIVKSVVKEQETFEEITINSSTNLTDVNNTYIDRTLKAFNAIDLDENKAKEMMLNNDVASNFYSHPRFELNKELIVLDKNINKRVELKLFDKDTQKEIDSSEVKWYQRTRYPEDKVFEANSNENNTTFKLSSNGILEWKDTKGSDERSSDEKSARVWASYKGYLYSAVVKVYSEYLSDVINNEELAKQAAKKLVDEQKWNDLPPLQRLIKAYEWMTKEVKYDHDTTTGSILKNQNAHSALVRKYTVCTGYAKGLKLILEELGIPCRFIEGSSDRESTISKHAWNLVQLDNEWYHVDATSDRTNTHTNFNFFLNTNDDFDKKDRFTKDFENQGKRWRNLKFKNFVSSEEDVLALIDNNWNIDKKQINTLSLVINNNNFKIATNAFNKRNLDVKSFRYGALYGPNKTVIYTFNQQSGDKLTEVKVNKVQQYNNKHAIKIELDQRVDDLKAGNFNIKNALIKDVKQENNSYILTLDHFSSYNSVDIKLESIKKKDYKFNLNGNTSVNINVQRQNKPNAEILVLDNDSIKITNNLNNLEYNFNNTSWKDVPNNFIIPSATIGTLYLRYKGSDDKLSSDSQKIDLIRSEIPTNSNIKSINKTLTGVNDKMQYRLKNNTNSDWTNIDKNKVSGLSSGTYQIRVKPLKNALASEIIEVNIN